MLGMSEIGSEFPSVLLPGIMTLFLITKRMRAPSRGLDNRDDSLYFLLFAGLICEQPFEWYPGLGEVENFLIPDW